MTSAVRNFVPAVSLIVVAMLATAPSGSAEGAEEACDGPKNLQAIAQGDGSILVTWDEWSFARAYEVWRAEPGMAAVQVGSGSGDNPDDGQDDPHVTTFLDTDTEVGITYTYHVRALGPPPHFSDVCGEATATAIPVFPNVLASGAAAMIGIGAYAMCRRRE